MACGFPKVLNLTLRQVPGHVAPHAVISPVLSAMGESTMGTPPRSKTRDRWPLPPLPQRTPLHGRATPSDRSQDSSLGVLTWGEAGGDQDSSRMLAEDTGRRVPRMEEEEADAATVIQGTHLNPQPARPYRDDEMLISAHERILQRKGEEELKQQRLMSHVRELPTRRQTELARAERAPLDAPVASEASLAQPAPGTPLRIADSRVGGVTANRTALSPSIAVPPQNGEGRAGNQRQPSHAPAKTPLAPPIAFGGPGTFVGASCAGSVPKGGEVGSGRADFSQLLSTDSRSPLSSESERSGLVSCSPVEGQAGGQDVAAALSAHFSQRGPSEMDDRLEEEALERAETPAFLRGEGERR